MNVSSKGIKMEENTINVDKIMEEIRAEIKEKGYKESDLQFKGKNGAYSETVELDEIKFDEDRFRKKVLLLNVRKNVSPNKTLYASNKKQKFSVFVKKVLRKSLKFYIEPIVSEQNEYNETNAELMMQVYALAKENEELRKRVEALEENIQ